MINKLIKITNNLYRGSAPSPKDVQWLHDNLGIKKIISLDKDTGLKIERVCKLLGINHIIIPLDGSRKSLINLIKHNLKDLLIKGGPTFFHCLYGKDRTGFLAALFECKYLGKNPEDAINDAKKLGFGVGVNPEYVNLFLKLIRGCKPVTDLNNNSDIVSNQREYKVDNRDTYLETNDPKSFAPYLGTSKQYPYDGVYSDINNPEEVKNFPIINKINDIPLVGIYNNDAGLSGAAPTQNVGGFIYD